MPHCPPVQLTQIVGLEFQIGGELPDGTCRPTGFSDAQIIRSIGSDDPEAIAVFKECIIRTGDFRGSVTCAFVNLQERRLQEEFRVLVETRLVVLGYTNVTFDQMPPVREFNTRAIGGPNNFSNELCRRTAVDWWLYSLAIGDAPDGPARAKHDECLRTVIANLPPRSGIDATLTEIGDAVAPILVQVVPQVTPGLGSILELGQTVAGALAEPPAVVPVRPTEKKSAAPLGLAAAAALALVVGLS